MPKLRKYTAKARAVKVAKGFIKHKMNLKSFAAEQGVTPQAIGKKVRRPEVQKILSKINEDSLRKAGATLTKAYQRIAEGLDATLSASFRGDVTESDVPDVEQRTRNAELVLELTGRKKTAHSEDITKPTEIHIHYGHRIPRISTIRPE